MYSNLEGWPSGENMSQKKLKLKPGRIGLLAEKALKKAVANAIVEHR